MSEPGKTDSNTPASEAAPRKPRAHVGARLKAAGLGLAAQEAGSPFLMAYLRFLSRVRQAEDHSVAPQEQALDPNEKALLELAVLRWAQRDPLTVRQAIGHAHLGSPATLHKRLMQLRHKSYLQLQDVAGDKRAKYLVPGPRGLEFMESMGRHMMGARRPTAKHASPD